MKKRIKLILPMTLAFFLAACGGSAETAETKAADSQKTEKAAVETTASEPEEDVSYPDLDTPFNTYMEARFSEDGKTAYLPLDNGECLQIEESEPITFAVATPDRKHVIVLLSSDELYETDIRLKKKKVISDNCSSSRVYPSNEGMCFQATVDKEPHLMRYTFEDENLVDLGACSVYGMSGGGMAAVAVSDGDLCLLPADSDELIRYPGLGVDNMKIKALPDDGSTVIWTETTDKSLTEKLYTLGADGTAQLLGDITVRGLVFVNYSKDSKLALVTSEYVSHLYIRDTSGQWHRVELPDGLKNEAYVYETDAGLLHQVNANEIHYLYVRCGNELCAVSPDGTITTIQKSVRDFDIIDGTLYYSDTGKNIYSASLNGAEVSESTLLLSGMDAFAVTQDGQYLYGMYVHEDDNKVRSLSVYPLHEENAAEIMLDENIYADSHVYLSAESGAAFYVTGAQRVADSYYYAGTLMVYHPETGETKTIDTDVYKDTFMNGKDYVIVSEYAQSTAGIGKFVSFHGDLMYRKKPADNTDGDRFDWYFYDGSELVLMVADLDY